MALSEGRGPRSARLIVALALAAAATGSGTVPALAVPLTSCQSTWSLVTSPSPGAGENILEGIAASGHNDAWAVGNVQMTSGGVRQTLTEHWDGTSWTVVASPNTGAGDNSLFNVAAVAPGNAWAVGRSYAAASGSPSQALVEHWNGSSWSIVPVPQVGSQDNVLGGVAATSANDVWAVGYSTPSSGALQTLIEHWNGAGWSVVQAPTLPGTGNSLLGAVGALTSTNAWAVGAYNQTPTAAAVSLIEHWDGTSWSIVPSPPNVPGTTGDNFLDSVAMTAANDVWAVGYGDTTQFSVTNPNPPSKTLVEHWDGTSWTLVTSQNVTGDDSFFGVSATPGQGNAWAVGASKTATVFQPLLERWNGSSFVSVASPNPNPAGGQLTAVMAISPNDVWSTGGSGTSGSYRTFTENYCVPPVVTAIAPTSGKPGTAVTVTGSGFLGASGANFGAAPAASFTVVSDTQITATAPFQSAGAVDVTVATAATSATSPADQFTFISVFPGQYTPLPPFRILDTRSSVGGFGTVGAGKSIDVQVAGVAGSGVPAMTSAMPPSAVILNVTVTNPTASGYLTLYPTGVPRPLASNLNLSLIHI